MIRTIPNFPNHTIDDLGNVYNIKLDMYLKPYSIHKNGTLYVKLHYKGRSELFNLAKLVLRLFQPSQTKINTFAIHKDLELQNCANFNLERGSRADRIRMMNEIRGKVRGVYAWNIGKNKYRAVIKNQQGKTETLGYFRNKWYAQHIFNTQYKKYYGKLPY